MTDFPVPAFEQAASIAGLKYGDLLLEPVYTPQSDADEDPREDGFVRTNRAHNLLQRFEDRLRRFIETLMEAEFGKNWVNGQVPPDVRQNWAERYQQALDQGDEEHPLIDYADFTDYEKIITKRENWRRVFSSIFTRNTLVIESFQRLYPIRRCTMHSRLISQDDVLYLYVETRRLYSAMDAVSSIPQLSGPPVLRCSELGC